MEKQIQTAYIQLDGFLPHSPFRQIQAYIYTESEHQAAQGYREALVKIRKLCYPTLTEGAISKTNDILYKALSKAEDKGDWLDELKEQIESWLESNHFSLGGDQKYIDVRELLPFIKSLKP